ncbi:MAG: AmmeMemoRadiSam system protein A [Thermoanaerobaculia bacterium]|nr:AmmeMemoRadiSam system protein A [Thermoanaerobaculia bacterium]
MNRLDTTTEEFSALGRACDLTEDDRRGALLVHLARHTLSKALDPNNAPPLGHDLSSESWLDEPGAVFITLRQSDGKLRGCIGSIEARRPLLEDLRHNAVAAAVRDPRFPPVGPAELGELRLEVSCLTKPVPIVACSEAEALQQLVPQADGIILSHGGHRATFLPQVWAQLPEPRDFLCQLKKKAGLPVDFWAADIRLLRYRVRKWCEI